MAANQEWQPIKEGHPFPPHAAPPRGHALHPTGGKVGAAGISPQPSRRGRATPPYGRGCPTTPHPPFGLCRLALLAANCLAPPRGCFASHPCGAFVPGSPSILCLPQGVRQAPRQHQPSSHPRRQGIPFARLADYSAVRRQAAPPASSRSRSLFAVLSVSQPPQSGIPCRLPPSFRAVRWWACLPPYPRASPSPPLAPRLGTLPRGTEPAPPFAPFRRCPGGTPIFGIDIETCVQMICFGGSLPPPNPC